MCGGLREWAGQSGKAFQELDPLRDGLHLGKRGGQEKRELFSGQRTTVKKIQREQN